MPCKAANPLLVQSRPAARALLLGDDPGMGYSTEFLRSFLSLIALIALTAIAIGAANELIGLGLFADGYPAPLTGPGAGYASFALQLGAGAALAIVVSLALDRPRNRDRSDHSK